MIGPIPATGPVSETTRDDPARVERATEQFEALLIAQLLKSAREAGDSSTEATAVYDLAEQQLAEVMTARGGLGLGTIILGQIRQNP